MVDIALGGGREMFLPELTQVRLCLLAALLLLLLLAACCLRAALLLAACCSQP
jgi:hypothetical protein